MPWLGHFPSRPRRILTDASYLAGEPFRVKPKEVEPPPEPRGKKKKKKKGKKKSTAKAEL